MKTALIRQQIAALLSASVEQTSVFYPENSLMLSCVLTVLTIRVCLRIAAVVKGEASYTVLYFTSL